MIEVHNIITFNLSALIYYTNESNINKKIVAAAIFLFICKKQTCHLSFFTQYTVYVAKLYDIFIIMQMMKKLFYDCLNCYIGLPLLTPK